MPVALALFLGLMADHLIDHALIFALTGERLDKAMPRHVVAAQSLPR
jgi:hypothetical protein